MILRALELEDMEPIRAWRNACLDTLRTPFPLTKEQQEAWYRDEICNRNSKSRFWAIDNDFSTTEPYNRCIEIVGYGGIENIQWENRIGEISLLISNSYQGKGFGEKAARMILDAAFNQLNLHQVYAECYSNNSAWKFWEKIFPNFTMLPDRKYYNGKYYDSYYFWKIAPLWMVR